MQKVADALGSIVVARRAQLAPLSGQAFPGDCECEDVEENDKATPPHLSALRPVFVDSSMHGIRCLADKR